MTWLNSHIIFKAVKLVTRVVQVWDFPLMTVPAELVKKQSIAKLMERKKKLSRGIEGAFRGGEMLLTVLTCKGLFEWCYLSLSPTQSNCSHYKQSC